MDPLLKNDNPIGDKRVQNNIKTITGSFINANHFAYWMELTLPIGLCLIYIGFTGKKFVLPGKPNSIFNNIEFLKIIVFIILLSFVSVIGAFSLSVSAIILIPVILLLFPLIMYLTKKKKKDLTQLIVILTIIFILSLWLVYRFDFNSIKSEIKGADFYTLNKMQPVVQLLL